MLSGKVYDYVKWINQTFIPGLAILIAALGVIWGWDLFIVGATVATVNAINFFIGTLLGFSSVQYYKEKQ